MVILEYFEARSLYFSTYKPKAAMNSQVGLSEKNVFVERTCDYRNLILKIQQRLYLLRVPLVTGLEGIHTTTMNLNLYLSYLLLPSSRKQVSILH